MKPDAPRTDVALEDVDGGSAVRLPVRVQPGARRRGVAGTWNGRLKLAVPAPALDGRANEELVRLVAELFGLRRAEVELVAGAGSRSKVLRLALPGVQCRRRLAELLAEDA